MVVKEQAERWLGERKIYRVRMLAIEQLRDNIKVDMLKKMTIPERTIL